MIARPRQAPGDRAATGPGPDCWPGVRSPLCEADGKQTFFKAFPGLRHLRIVRELGDNGVAASICSRSYAPTMVGIAAKIAARLR